LEFLFNGDLPNRSFELFSTYQVCYQVLQAADDPRAGEILAQAYRLLQEWVEGIEDEGLRRRLWEEIPAHYEIVTAYKSRHGTRQQITVRLPCADAPLGRPLQDDEYTAVTWTVAAPEDNLLPNKTARRRQRLQRLLEEAHAQGAAPTQADLAAALGVSRRTVERDVAALREQGEPPPPTRGM
jgi:hypothetical protein